MAFAGFTKAVKYSQYNAIEQLTEFKEEISNIFFNKVEKVILTHKNFSVVGEQL